MAFLSHISPVHLEIYGLLVMFLVGAIITIVQTPRVQRELLFGDANFHNDWVAYAQSENGWIAVGPQTTFQNAQRIAQQHTTRYQVAVKVERATPGASD